MAQYEGFVASVRDDGIAEVIIRPMSEGIPGATSYVNRRVCHCATDGSTLTVQALNSAGAGVGDRVSVNRSTKALVRNALALVGIPAAALCLGIAFASLLTRGFTAFTTGGLLSILTSLAIGIAVGAIIFRRISAADAPVIDRIVQTRKEWASMTVGGPFPCEDGSTSCEACR